MNEVTLSLRTEEINAILQTLGNLPTSSGAFPLLMKIKEQAKSQLAAQTEVVTGE
jgi:hypothetical protein